MNFWTLIEAKCVMLESISAHCQRARLNGHRIVFTNGCFDILHEGHVRYLADARSLGDLLIVGINSDASVSRLKGAERPINGQESRSRVLASLEVVDLVVVFDTDTPEELIHLIRPDILVKGGDWSVDQIVGGAFVNSYGGEVKSLPFHTGFSTTGLVEKIRML
jgi:D-beta-D-heptose 7-phosphate kinase/D-beta-D-heptose 1-phosphate adenosyltransferase